MSHVSHGSYIKFNIKFKVEIYFDFILHTINEFLLDEHSATSCYYNYKVNFTSYECQSDFINTQTVSDLQLCLNSANFNIIKIYI
jgi:hypothetical protein